MKGKVEIMLDTLLKLLSFEEFKDTKRIDCMSGFKETADGYSYEIYGGGRIYCNWQKEYKNYCERRQTYIKRITPIYNFLKANKNKSYLLEELRQELNDNTIKSSTMLSLLKNNIVKRIEVNTVNENGCHIVIAKYQINQTEVES